MTHSDIGSERTIVVSPTEAKQGNRKRMNLRVLIGSMIGITLLGAILLFAFFKATPPGMDASPTNAETQSAPAAETTAPDAVSPPTAVAPKPAEPAPAP